MKTTTKVEHLQTLIEADDGKKRERIKAIEKLLDKLDEKESKYGKKLKHAVGKKEKEKYDRKLSVCKAQIKKGKAVLKELKH